MAYSEAGNWAELVFGAMPCFVFCRRLARWDFPIAGGRQSTKPQAFLPHPACVHTAEVIVWACTVRASDWLLA